MISEVWYSMQKKDKPYERPSESPDKKEAISIAGMTYSGSSEMLMYAIGKDGKMGELMNLKKLDTKLAGKKAKKKEDEINAAKGAKEAVAAKK